MRVATASRSSRTSSKATKPQETFSRTGARIASNSDRSYLHTIFAKTGEPEGIKIVFATAWDWCSLVKACSKSVTGRWGQVGRLLSVWNNIDHSHNVFCVSLTHASCVTHTPSTTYNNSGEVTLQVVRPNPANFQKYGYFVWDCRDVQQLSSFEADPSRSWSLDYSINARACVVWTHTSSTPHRSRRLSFITCSYIVHNEKLAWSSPRPSIEPTDTWTNKMKIILLL